MALTRITSSVIKDNTIQEGKFDKPYLDATNADTATQAITFQSDVNIRVGSVGATFFSAGSNLVTITAQTAADTALNIARGNLSISDGNITLTGTNRLNVPFVNVGNGSTLTPSIYFGGDTSTGLFRSESPNSLNLTVDGTPQLSVSPSDGIIFNNRSVKLLGAGSTFEEILRYDTQTNSFQIGKNVKKTELVVDNDVVVNIRSVDGSGAAYPNNENRVGINNTNPQAALDVTGAVRATSYLNIQETDLPLITTNKGGTGLSQIGFPEQLLRVNSAGTGFEYFTLNTGDVNNLASFNVSGDGTLYDIVAIGTSGGRTSLQLPNASTFFTGQDIKVFGLNTKDIVQYDQNTVGTTIYSTWKTSIDQSTSFVTSQGGVGGGVRYTYYAALINFNTGVISSLKKLKHSATGAPDYVTNYELDTFNDQRYNSVALLRPNATHGILLYRYKSTTAVVQNRDGFVLNDHDTNLNLIAVIGQRDIGSSTTTLFTYNDYGPYDRTTWGDFNTDGSYNQEYQEIKTIRCFVPTNQIPSYGPYPGWSERKVYDVNTGSSQVIITSADAGSLYDATDQQSAYINQANVQVCHDDTAALEDAIESVINKGLNSLFLTGGTYLVKRLAIPSTFSLTGSGKATVIKKQYFDTSYNRTPSPEYNRLYSAIWLRNPVDSLGNPSNTISQPVKDVTLRAFAIDGNYNCNIRLGDSTRPDGNTLVYLANSQNCSISDLDIRNSVGDAVNAENAFRLSIQNTLVYDNSITYLTFDNPLQATDAQVLKVSDCAFLSNPGPVDVTTSEVVAFNSCIIRNSGTGLRTYGTRSANVENNLVLGPDDEWIPSSDVYDSDFNSVNITCYKSTGAGTQGPIKFTYVEQNIVKDLTNTTVEPFVYTVNVDVNGNEIFSSTPLTYIPTGSSDPISVLQASLYDVQNGGVQIEIPATVTTPAPSGTALAAIPYRSIVGIQGTNYNYIVYFVVGTENIAVGDPDNYIIDGVIGYNSANQIYTVRIADEFISEFTVEDVVTLLEHNPTSGYSLPVDLIVTAIRFEQQSFVLDLFDANFNSFNATFNAANIDPAGDLIVDENARGYIKKKNTFTIAKGIIGVV